MATVIKMTRTNPEHLPSGPLPTSNQSRAMQWWKGIRQLPMWRQVVLAVVVTWLIGSALTWMVQRAMYLSVDQAEVERKVSAVHSRIPGLVRAIHVKEGAEVHPGDLLVTFEDAEWQIEKRFKEAKVKKASADFERAKRLLDTQAISKADFELAETNARFAQADLEGTELKLKFSSVLAVTPGVVARIHAHEGLFVQPGQSLVTLVAPLENATIRAQVKETELRFISLGQKAVVTLDAYPGKTWNGAVTSIAPTSAASLSLLPLESSSGHFTRVAQKIAIRIALDEKVTVALHAGLSARVRLRK